MRQVCRQGDDRLDAIQQLSLYSLDVQSWIMHSIQLGNYMSYSSCNYFEVCAIIEGICAMGPGFSLLPEFGKETNTDYSYNQLKAASKAQIIIVLQIMQSSWNSLVSHYVIIIGIIIIN